MLLMVGALLYPDYRETRTQYKQIHRKTRSITIRLDPNIIDELQRDADQEEISLNVLVGHILRRYCDWDRYQEKLDMIPVPKTFLVHIMDYATYNIHGDGMKKISPYREQIIEEVALRAFNVVKDSVLFIKKNYDLWTVLALLQLYMKVSNITSDHIIEGEKRHLFIIQHDLGQNWSLFTKDLLNHIFENLPNVRANVEASFNSVVAKIEF